MGATHPNEVREQGEAYRVSLEILAANKVERNVIFYNSFVDLDTLKESRVGPLLNEVLTEFSGRHEKIGNVFLERFELVRELLSMNGELSESRKLLIGSADIMNQGGWEGAAPAGWAEKRPKPTATK